jgi:hypothetical protein
LVSQPGADLGNDQNTEKKKGPTRWGLGIITFQLY